MFKFEDITPEMIEIFWSKVKKGENGECNDWIGVKVKNGYGQLTVNINGKWINISAHRFAYMIYHQQNIPEGMCICHHCDRPACISKNCLFLANHKQNMEDKVKKGRSKLTEKTKNKISIAHKGKKISEERRLAIIKSNTGRRHTEETKKKISEANKGKKISEECKLKLRNANLGKHHTEEAKLKMSISRIGNKYCLGYKHTEEAKLNMSKASIGNKSNTGRKLSEEHKQNIKKSWDARKLKASQS